MLLLIYTPSLFGTRFVQILKCEKMSAAVSRECEVTRPHSATDGTPNTAREVVDEKIRRSDCGHIYFGHDCQPRLPQECTAAAHARETPRTGLPPAPLLRTGQSSSRKPNWRGNAYREPDTPHAQTAKDLHPCELCLAIGTRSIPNHES